MNINVQLKDMKYFSAREIALITKVLDFIAGKKQDKKELNRLILEWTRLRQKVYRDKLPFIHEQFKDIEAELKLINRKLI